MTFLRRIFTAILLLAVMITSVSACPTCTAPTITIAEQVENSDVVVLVRIAKATPPSPEGGDIGTTTYRIEKVLTNRTSTDFQPGTEIERLGFQALNIDQLCLMTAISLDQLEWAAPIAFADESIDYLTSIPSQETPIQDRLRFYLNYLQFQDDVVADDAYGEFANAPFEDIVAIKSEFDQKLLGQWMMDPQTKVTRVSLYGIMLGVCGDENSQKLFEQKIFEQEDKFRLGIEGIMFGYLLLTKEEGLKKLEKEKLSVDSGEKFSETFAAMQAVELMWKYGGEAVTKDRLRNSLRILLDRSELADLVIINLARWEDWSAFDDIVSLYDKEDYNIPAIKRAIVGYLLQLTRSAEKEEAKVDPQLATKATKKLEHLEEVDPKTVKTARLLFR